MTRISSYIAKYQLRKLICMTDLSSSFPLSPLAHYSVLDSRDSIERGCVSYALPHIPYYDEGKGDSVTTIFTAIANCLSD